MSSWSAVSRPGLVATHELTRRGKKGLSLDAVHPAALPKRIAWVALADFTSTSRTASSHHNPVDRPLVTIHSPFLHNRTVLGFATKMRKSLPPFR